MTTERTHASRSGLGITAAICVAVVAGMVGLSFAAVPIYQLFCQVTGYGGTTQRAERPSGQVIDRTVTVRFDANVGNGLGWRFRPVSRPITLKVGETAEARFVAENTTDRTITATATFNVTPERVGVHFNKIACFCFTEQTLKPGEKIEMPVLFFVDPSIAGDRELDYVTTVTLSYTFFPTEGGRDGDKPVAALPGGSNKL